MKLETAIDLKKLVEERAELLQLLRDIDDWMRNGTKYAGDDGVIMGLMERKRIRERMEELLSRIES